MSSPVDVLAVMDRVAASKRTLREFARDTGPFRVNKPGAADLAEACTAALAVIEASDAVAELVDAAAELSGLIGFRIDDPRVAAHDRLRAAVARVGGAK